ncbi:luciferin sulfotransferase [Anabrus simplex]|uniref:luciferin sulfotransferase n=1 Tax=Anabrus simplex TaxID=316456 RepID=UPI0035A3D594
MSQTSPYTIMKIWMEMSLQFEDIKTPLSEKFRSSNKRIYCNGSVRVSPSDCILPVKYKQFADRIKNFEVREDDVWIVTYPKCGTTWTQEMVWLLINNMDFNRATQENLFTRSPFIEYGFILEDDDERRRNVMDTITLAENSPSPRCIKCHLPKDLLPDQLWTKKPKIVYVTRGVKDVLVSYYNHHRLLNGYTGSLDDFAEAFMSESVVYWDPFWKNTLDFWNMRNEENVLVNSYEEMKKDLPGIIRKTAKFLGKEFSEEQFLALAEHLDFSKMKDNPMVNFEEQKKKLNEMFCNDATFMRRGEVGTGKKELSPELAARVDKWSKERIQGTGYPFVG